MQTSMDQTDSTSTSTTNTSRHFQVHWKRNQVVTIDAEAPLWEAVQLMKQHQIGDVIVVDRASEKEDPIGMVTDRDIALCMSENLEFRDLRVLDVMSDSIITASVDDDLFQIIRTMKNGGVTRLPLMNEQREVVGIVTAKNILQILAGCFLDVTQISEQQQQNEVLNQH